jgi:Fur family transcriptional regulator, ferric uptake regulator
MKLDEGHVHDEISTRLAAVGQRYTSGRRQLVDVLVRSGRPLTLPEVLREEPELSQSSAYRNLAVLEEAMVVRRLVQAGDHAYYELAESLTEHHHHLVCDDCASIMDVTLSPALEAELDKAFHRLVAKHGFTPRTHALDVYGTCASCRVVAAT